MKITAQKLMVLICSGLLVLSFIFPSMPVEAASKKKSSSHSHKSGKKKAAKGKHAKGKASKKKKHGKKYKATRCNPEQGKRQALEFLTSNETLAKLADLKLRPQTEMNFSDVIANDGEMDEAQLQELSQQGEDVKELEQEDNVSVDVNSFQKLWLSYMEQMDGDDSYTVAGIEKKALMAQLLDWIGTRYHMGGTSRTGIDCSAFIQRVHLNAAGILLPRTASEQSTVGMRIKSIADLQFGDLIFFHTRKRVHVSHVGMYLGNNLFAHSSSRYGVTVSSLESTYYNARFLGGSRLTDQDVSVMTVGNDNQASLETSSLR